MITLYDYQEPAAAWLSRRRSGCVKAPTGSGKTLIAAGAIRKVLDANPYRMMIPHIGWLCNTIEQKDQAWKALRAFRITREAHCEVECAAANTDWSDCSLLVIDEAQHSMAPLWFNQIQSCQGARWFFSATPFGEDWDQNNALMELYGEVYEISADAVKSKRSAGLLVMHNDTDPGLQEIIDKEIQARMKSRMWQVSRGMDPQKLWGQIAAQVGMEIGIVGNELRNMKIEQIANSNKDKSTLILVQRKEHGEKLVERIPGSVVLTSKVGNKKRKQIFEDLRLGEIKCVIGTSLFDEGADVPILSVLIMACGGRNNNRTIQRVGRVLRAYEGKTHAVIHDFYDTQHPLLAKHSRARRDVYHEIELKELAQDYENLAASA